MRKLKLVVFIVNILCIGWISYLLLGVADRVEPLEEIIGKKNYDEIIPHGIELMTKQAYEFYVPTLIVLILNVFYVYYAKAEEVKP